MWKTKGDFGFPLAKWTMGLSIPPSQPTGEREPTEILRRSPCRVDNRGSRGEPGAVHRSASPGYGKDLAIDSIWGPRILSQLRTLLE
ncbi:hypothetical protein LIA77_02368 [Sarocladium implicatum]|nr:hypothetical protein LIA77_02368 [Sarocladium implicatum]